MHTKISTHNITKLIFCCMLIIMQQLSAISSNMTHRVMSSSPLLYKMIDYSKEQNCFEFEPIYTSMYDQEHTISNLTPFSKQTLIFDQQGNGDINPSWLNLLSNNTLANYLSAVTFTPSMSQSGMLLHWYDQFDKFFFEIKTALVQCKSSIEIEEVGGNNGLVSGIMNAQQAFTQADWNYGKIGQVRHVVGLDDIEVRFGAVSKATSNASSYDLLISGFGIIQAPTGSGTTAEYLFEPQVGTNHWGLGFGFESLISGDDDLKFMIAGNYRYLIPAWETRSFDLLQCGPWSRYLGVQDAYGLPIAPATLPLPGINYFTQQAYLNGRSQLNLYARLQKQFKSSMFEISYNFLCTQQETIGAIKNIHTGYGIYALTGAAGGAGGVTTAPTAMINQDITALDPLGLPSTITVDQFDKLSACAQTYASNNITARLEIKNNNIIYGFGASIESALSASALSTWSVWAQFGFVFDTERSCNDHDDHELPDLHQLNYLSHELDDVTAEMISPVWTSDDPIQPTEDADNTEQDMLEHINLMTMAPEGDAPREPLDDLSIEETNELVNEPIDEEVDALFIPQEHPFYTQEQEDDFITQSLENNETISLADHDLIEQINNGISLDEHKNIADSLENNLTVALHNHYIDQTNNDSGLSLQSIDEQTMPAPDALAPESNGLTLQEELVTKVDDESHNDNTENEEEEEYLEFLFSTNEEDGQ